MRRLYERKQKNKDKDSAPVYKSGYGDALKNNLAKVMEKKNFTYDADKDKLFSQYKNSYEKSGRTAMRDTITPVGDDFMLDMVLERNDNSIDRISYEVCSIDGQTVTKEGTAKEANGLVRLNLEGRWKDRKKAY